MTVPARNTQVVGQGLARLTSAFITKPNVRAMLAVYLRPFQDLEDATWGVLTDRFLATTAVNTNDVSIPGMDNSVFDVLGRLVGVQRGGLGDLSFKTVIYLEIAVNRATGRTTDWGKFFTILEPYTSGTVIYLDGDAAFIFALFDLTLDPNQVGTALNRAVPNGIGGFLSYTTWPAGNDLIWSDANGDGGQGVWGGAPYSSIGGLMEAAFGWGPGLSPLFASELP